MRRRQFAAFSLLASLIVMPGCGSRDGNSPSDVMGERADTVRQTNHTQTGLKRLLARTESRLKEPFDPAGVVVRWRGPEDLAAIVVHDGPGISLSALSCVRDSTIDEARCIIDSEPEVFGVDGESLRHRDSTGLPGGFVLDRFDQTLAGFQIMGATVRTVIDPTTHAVLALYSDTIQSPYPSVPVETMRGASVPNDLPAALRASLQSRFATHAITANRPRLILTRIEDSQYVEPVWRFDVEVGGTDKYLATVSFDLTALVDLDPTTRPAELLSDGVWAQHSLNQCATDMDCSAPFDNCVRYRDSPDQRVCVRKCKKDSECAGFSDGGYLCQIQAGACARDYGSGYQQCAYDSDCPESRSCILDPKMAGWCVRRAGEPLKLYDSETGWCDKSTQGVSYFSNTVETLQRWEEFLRHDLGRNGWDNQGGTMRVKLGPPCLEPSCGPGPSATGGHGEIYYHAWDNLDAVNPTSQATVNQFRAGRSYLFGHEGGHNVNQSIIGDSFLGDTYCMSENMAILLGRLFAHHVLGPVRWSDPQTSNCGTTSAWYDQGYGLAHGAYCFIGTSHNVPWALRSRFDTLPCAEPRVTSAQKCRSSSDCPPYWACDEDRICASRWSTHSAWYQNNGAIWLRVARVLSEGTDTFEIHEHSGEQTGDRMAGLGDALTYRIIYTAMMHLTNPDAHPLDFSQYLIDAGYLFGHGRDVEIALGTAGFPSETNAIGGIAGIGRIWWPKWKWDPTIVEIQIYIDQTEGTLLGRYWVKGDPVVTKLADKVSGSFAAVAFKDFIYLFYQDAQNHMMLRRLAESGEWLDAVDLSDSFKEGARTSLAAAVQHDQIVLAFVDEDGIVLGRCAGDCEREWNFARVGSSAEAGASGSSAGAAGAGSQGGRGDTATTVALAVASGVNGTSPSDYEYLYMVTADRLANNQVVVRQYTSNNALVSERRLPCDLAYPSCQAVGSARLDIAIRDAAFESMGRYIYLGWKDPANQSTYLSVIQDWGVDQTKAWFTRSVPLFSHGYTGSGPIFTRKPPDANGGLEITTISGSWLTGLTAYSTVIFGRY